MGLLPINDGFLYIKTEPAGGGRVKANFFGYDIKSRKTVPVTKWTYFQYKFGDAYRTITPHLKDYVTCKTALLSDNYTAVIYPDGDLGLFNYKGTPIWTGNVSYRDEPLQGAAAAGSCFWSTVPSLNSVVCYSLNEKRVTMRVGSEKSDAFLKPVDVSGYDDRLFVCCSGSCKVRTISLSDYEVKDYLIFGEPVLEYFVSGSSEFVRLESGIYELDS